MSGSPALPVEVMTLDPAGLARDAALGRALLALNNAHAIELSLLTPGRLEMLVARAFWAGRVGWGRDRVGGMVIAFDQDAAYDSVNFQWFRARYGRFVYVDRVVVDPAVRGRGVARALYVAVMARAEAAGHGRVVCEVNVEPPNPASAAMHAGMGFVAVGDGDLGEKRVAYLARELGAG